MDVKLDGSSFSVNYWKDFSEKDFVSENIKSGVYKAYLDKDRRAMLKEVYKRIINDPALTAKKS